MIAKGSAVGPQGAMKLAPGVDRPFCTIGDEWCNPEIREAVLGGLYSVSTWIDSCLLSGDAVVYRESRGMVRPIRLKDLKGEETDLSMLVYKIPKAATRRILTQMQKLVDIPLEFNPWRLIQAPVYRRWLIEEGKTARFSPYVDPTLMKLLHFVGAHCWPDGMAVVHRTEEGYVLVNDAKMPARISRVRERTPVFEWKHEDDCVLFFTNGVTAMEYKEE